MSLDRAKQLAAQLRAGSVKAAAYVDPAEAAANLPCILIVPPVQQLAGGPITTWRLVCLAGTDIGSEQSWSQLDQLLTAAAAELPLDRCDPSSYTLGALTVPAYLLTFTESG